MDNIYFDLRSLKYLGEGAVISKTSAELASIQAVSPVSGWPITGKLTRYHLRSGPTDDQQAYACDLRQNHAQSMFRQWSQRVSSGLTSHAPCKQS